MVHYLKWLIKQMIYMNQKQMILNIVIMKI